MIKTMKDDTKTNKYNRKMDKKKRGAYFTNVFYEYNISGYTLKIYIEIKYEKCSIISSVQDC